MNVLEGISFIVTYIEAGIGILERILSSRTRLMKLLRRHSRLAYENIFLDEELDLQDPRGERAVLYRRQRVKLLTSEPAIIRDLCWGEGNPLAHFRAQGASKLAVRREGSKSVILLALNRRGGPGETRVLRSRRLIRDEFSDPRGYFELLVERPTKRISLKVIFPKSRPPRETEATSTPSRPHAQPVRHWLPDGRIALHWSQQNPVPFTQYSLRWSW